MQTRERFVDTLNAVTDGGKRLALRRYVMQIYDPTLTDSGGVVGWIDGDQYRLKLPDGTPVYPVEGRETFEIFGTGEGLRLI